MLKTGRVEVWRLDLNPEAWTEAKIDSWRAMLSAEELRRADAFRATEHQQDYVASHVILRWALAKELGIAVSRVAYAPGSMENAAGERRKPALCRETQGRIPDSSQGGVPGSAQGRIPDLDLRFSLSHTSGAALVAVALGCEVGVDIELRRPMDDLDSMARSVMSDVEFEGWSSLSREQTGTDGRNSSEQLSAFFNLWTRKESYLKAIGLGLYHSLQEVTVPVSADRLQGGPDRSMLTGGVETAWRKVIDTAGEGEWMVADLPVGENYSAAICCQGSKAPDVDFLEINL